MNLYAVSGTVTLVIIVVIVLCVVFLDDEQIAFAIDILGQMFYLLFLVLVLYLAVYGILSVGHYLLFELEIM